MILFETERHILISKTILKSAVKDFEIYAIESAWKKE